MTIRNRALLAAATVASVLGAVALSKVDFLPWYARFLPHEIEPHVSAHNDEVALAAMRVNGSRAAARMLAVQRFGQGGRKVLHKELLSAPNPGPRADQNRGPRQGDRLSADPTLAYGPDGTLYLSWLVFSTLPGAAGEPFDMGIAVAMARPGQPFSAPVIVSERPRVEYDKPWSAVLQDGSLHVVYRASDGRSAGLYDVSLPAPNHAGGPWPGAVRDRTLVEEPAFAGTLPTLCVDTLSPALFVAYVHPGVSAGPGLFGFFFDAQHIDPPRLLSSRPVAVASPSCVFWNQQAFVLWGDSDLPWDTGRSALLRQLTVVAVAPTQPGGPEKAGVPGLVSLVRELSLKDRLFLHPQLVLAPDRPGETVSLHIVTLMGQGENDPKAGVFSLRLPLTRTHSPGVPSPGPLIRKVFSGVTLTTRRDATTWPGDYLGAANVGGQIVVGYIDNRGGRMARLGVSEVPSRR